MVTEYLAGALEEDDAAEPANYAVLLLTVRNAMEALWRLQAGTAKATAR